MTCFLTSAPVISPDTFEFTDANGFLTEMKAVLRPHCNALFICSDPDAHEKTDDFSFRVYISFERSGISIKGMDILDGRNIDRAEELVKRADFIILAGGHVPTQNLFFEDIGLRELLEDFDGVLMGISAGTMNSAETVYAQPEREGEAVDPAYERFLTGLGLTEKMVLPHYHDIKEDILDGMRIFEEIAYPDSTGRKFYCLPDGSFILIKDGKEEIRGECWLIEDGNITKISEDGDIVR